MYLYFELCQKTTQIDAGVETEEVNNTEDQESTEVMTTHQQQSVQQHVVRPAVVSPAVMGQQLVVKVVETLGEV